MKPNVLIFRSAGTNCDGETAHAFELAGGVSQRIHINQVLRDPQILERFQIMAFPGGFSYGDDIAAGRILANQVMHHLHDPLHAFVDAGKPIIGICNGFQVLIKTNLLPGSDQQKGQTCTLTNNDCGRFVDRWIHLQRKSSKCIWTEGIERIELPIAHGEGKFVPGDNATRKSLWANDQVALVYTKSDGSPAGGALPDNPNGSIDDIAGICDPSGLVFGLMPHPERFVSPTQHPAWTSRPRAGEGAGLAVFRNAIRHVGAGVGSGV